METKLPATQAEQVEDEFAPVAAEYVPGKASDEECMRVSIDTRISERCAPTQRISERAGTHEKRSERWASHSTAPAEHKVTFEEPAGQ
jgi:hypothetical protein